MRSERARARPGAGLREVALLRWCLTGNRRASHGSGGRRRGHCARRGRRGDRRGGRWGWRRRSLGRGWHRSGRRRRRSGRPTGRWRRCSGGRGAGRRRRSGRRRAGRSRSGWGGGRHREGQRRLGLDLVDGRHAPLALLVGIGGCAAGRVQVGQNSQVPEIAVGLLRSRTCGRTADRSIRLGGGLICEDLRLVEESHRLLPAPPVMRAGRLLRHLTDAGP